MCKPNRVVQVVLERHADQVGDGVLRCLDQSFCVVGWVRLCLLRPGQRCAYQQEEQQGPSLVIFVFLVNGIHRAAAHYAPHESKYSKFESESKHRPLQRCIEQEVVLIVIHFQVAVTQHKCVVFMDIHTRGSDDLVCEV
jgi:hypothetical protein